MPQPSPLTLESITVTFARRDGTHFSVIRDLSLEVKSGEIVSLVGRSGGGKTSLLRVACGNLRPSAGRVLWNGEEVAWHSQERMSEQHRGFLGVTHQDNPGLDDLSAVENVLLGTPPSMLGKGRRARHEAAERAATALKALAISDPQVRFGLMSGGERQRVNLARAFFNDPHLVLLDEPSSALDRQTTEVVAEMQRQRADAGTAILLATHDPLLTPITHHTVRLEDPAPTEEGTP